MLWNRNLVFVLETLVGDKQYLYQESCQGSQPMQGNKFYPVVFQYFFGVTQFSDLAAI